MHNYFLVFNKYEWQLDTQSKYPMFGFTDEELDNADEKGLIKTKYGVDCYITRPIKMASSD